MTPEKKKTVTIVKDVVGHGEDHFRGDVADVPESFAHELIHSDRAVEGEVDLENIEKLAKKPDPKGKGKVANRDPQ